MRNQPNKVQMDNKFRVCLGSLLSKEEREQISSFRIHRQKDGKIILDPQVEIPAREHWIYKNPEALASLMKGLKEAKEGKTSELDIDFSEFVNDDEI